MAKPIYIICSEGGSEDRISGRISLYNLIEKILIQKVPPQTQGILVIKGLSIWVTTMWRREAEEEGREFEFQIQVQMPSSDDIVEIGAGAFVFNHIFQRIGARIDNPLPISAPGTMIVRSRIRRAETSDWIVQECPIDLEEMKQPTETPPPANETDSDHRLN
jgi:hypothetical protein